MNPTSVEIMYRGIPVKGTRLSPDPDPSLDLEPEASCAYSVLRFPIWSSHDKAGFLLFFRLFSADSWIRSTLRERSEAKQRGNIP